MALPAIIQGALTYALGFTLSKLVAKVVSALGIGYITYKGLDILFQNLGEYINATVGAVPEPVAQSLAIMNVPTAINMILSAYMSSATINVVNKRLVFNPGGNNEGTTT